MRKILTLLFLTLIMPAFVQAGFQERHIIRNGAPTEAPPYVGAFWIDVSSGNLYFGTGTSSSGDWQLSGTGTTPTPGASTQYSVTAFLGSFDTLSQNDLLPDDARTDSGTPSINATNKFGGGSVLFGGGSDYQDYEFNATYLLGEADWTIEMWVNNPALGTECLLSMSDATSPTTGFALVSNGTGRVQFDYADEGGTAKQVLTTGSYSASTWTHIAVVNASGTITIYFDGTADATTGTQVGSILSTADTINLRLGAQHGASSRNYSGYIDDLRITQKAVYTSNFTAPTAALEEIFISVPQTTGGFLTPASFTIQMFSDMSGLTSTSYNSDANTAWSLTGTASTSEMIIVMDNEARTNTVRYFDGTISNYMQNDSSPIITTGIGNFSVEAIISLDETNITVANTGLWGNVTNTSTLAGMQFLAGYGNGKEFQALSYNNNTNTVNTGVDGIAKNQWVHVVYSYNDTTGYGAVGMKINGLITDMSGVTGGEGYPDIFALDATSTSAMTGIALQNMFIGGSISPLSAGMQGWISEIAFHHDERYPSKLVDGNTVVFWDFRNTTASGNEPGWSGSDQGGDLTLTQAGGLSGAIDTSPAASSLDDNYYRVFDGTDDTLTANQTYLSSSSDFTLETVVRLDNVGISHYLFTNTVSNTPAGVFLGYQSGNNFRFFYADGATAQSSIDVNGMTVSINKWYHVVVTKSGTTYNLYVADIAVDGFITSASDVAALPANQKASVVDADPFTSAANGQISRTGGIIDGDVAWTRISNIARYE